MKTCVTLFLTVLLLACKPSDAIDTSGGPLEKTSTKRDALCAGGHVLFHCTTSNHKKIQLCDQGNTIDYSFRKEGETPELALSVPREDASTFQWKGMGRWINYSITIPNDNTEYSVFTSFDRLSDAHEFEAGVIATVDDVEVAKLVCKEPIIHNLEGVDLKQGE